MITSEILKEKIIKLQNKNRFSKFAELSDLLAELRKIDSSFPQNLFFSVIAALHKEGLAQVHAAKSAMAVEMMGGISFKYKNHDIFAVSWINQ